METPLSPDEAPAHVEDIAFAREILPLVSRTFAPGIDILPEELADPIRLAYLICRVADTVEDAVAVSAEIRRGWLMHFAVLLRAEPENDYPAGRLAGEIVGTLRAPTAEVRLIEELPRLVRLLRDTDPEQRRIIGRWSRELSLGMARFLALEEKTAGGWTALTTVGELEAYEYYVAGTVGCMLHELIATHLPGWHADTDVRPLAVSFGLGLQGVNILQDMSVDRARGWSYIPEEIASRHGTETSCLHLPGERAAAMSVVREMAGLATRHLDDGFSFVLTLPRRVPRVRLFCLWPLLLALRTLARIVSSNEVIHARVRISREEVRELTREAIGACLSEAALSRLYKRERRRVSET
jgi:farnesyl-diphosphate farnesyltransferase